MIEADSKVTLHFSLRLADGSLADSTQSNGQPATVQLGKDILSAAMEQQLYGLRAGEKKTFVLAPQDAVGMPNPANIQQLPRAQFPESLLLEEGLIIQFEQQGRKIPGVIRRLAAESVTVDFNHPLAGQPLTVAVEIIAVEK